MVIEYGFSDKLGAIKWGSDDDQTTVMDGLQPRKYSDRTAEVIDDEVLKLVETAHTEAWTIINDNREILDELVRQLLVKETLNEKELGGDLRADQEGSGSSGVAVQRPSPRLGQAAGGDSRKP